MLKRDSNFRRIRFGGWGWNGSASYWLAKDHLLVVEVSNYTERYRRFYFRDIQAMVIQQNQFRLWMNLLLCALLVLAMTVVAAILSTSGNLALGEYIGVGVFTGVAVLLLLGVIRNTVLGRTCSVQLRTAVQTQKLKNLRRWRAAEKLTEQLKPLILAAQTAAAATIGAEVPAAAPSVTPEPPAGGGPIAP